MSTTTTNPNATNTCSTQIEKADTIMDRRSWSNPRPHILIVDDEESILTSLSEILSITFNDFQISTATSAEEALDILYDQSADLIITDLKLPEMDGLELTQSVKSISPETHSILITAFGTGAISDTATKLGCLAYLEKPFDIDVLLHYANMALEHKTSSVVAKQELCLSEALRLYMQCGKNVIISIVEQGHSGVIVAQAGRIVHAQFRNKSGCKALMTMLKLDDPLIRPLKYKPPFKKTLSVSWQTLQAAIDAPTIETQLALLRGSLTSTGRVLIQSTTSSVMRRNKSSQQSIQKKLQIRDQTQLIDFDKHFNPSKEPTHQPEALNHNEDTLNSNGSLNISLLVNTGISLFRAHKLQEAGQYWRKALELDKNCQEAKTNLSILQMIQQAKKSLH